MAIWILRKTKKQKYFLIIQKYLETAIINTLEQNSARWFFTFLTTLVVLKLNGKMKHMAPWQHSDGVHC